MNPSTLTISVSENIGTISAALLEATKAKAVLVLAHGAGANMNHAFMVSLSEELAARGVTTLRFNFPYMEHKKNRPDPPAIAGKTIAMAIAKARALYGNDIALFAGGKSFGGRMTSTQLSKDNPDNVKGIVFFGFPLHAIGSPSLDRAEHLSAVAVPMLFLQGTRDKLAEIDLVTKVCASLPLATLSIVEGADHSFKAGKQNLIPDLAERTARWINNLPLI